MKKICSTCGKIVGADHICPNKIKDKRRKDINVDSRWRKIRAQARERDLCCKLCWSQGTYSPIEEVHHIVPREVCDEDQVFDVRNVISLCRSCHHEVHREGWQKYVDTLKEMIDND